MSRRRYIEDSHNHERWVVSYADFITLLFAFFVVMYSVSSVNEGKYKVLTDSLENVFNSEPKQKTPIYFGDYDAHQANPATQAIAIPLPGVDLDKEIIAKNLDDSSALPVKKIEENSSVANKNLQDISEQLKQDLSGLINDQSVSIVMQNEWIEVDIKSNILFASGKADSSIEAQNMVKKIAAILANYNNSIQVQGFTDNVPIETDQYPSNWELSSARAAAIVRLLAEAKVDPRRMSIVGYAEFKPIASNDTEMGKQKNRRVVLVISKEQNVTL